MNTNKVTNENSPSVIVLELSVKSHGLLHVFLSTCCFFTSKRTNQTYTSLKTESTPPTDEDHVIWSKSPEETLKGPYMLVLDSDSLYIVWTIFHLKLNLILRIFIQLFQTLTQPGPALIITCCFHGNHSLYVESRSPSAVGESGSRLSLHQGTEPRPPLWHGGWDLDDAISTGGWDISLLDQWGFTERKLSPIRIYHISV